MDKLLEAFNKKEKAEIFLFNLEKMRKDHSVDEAFYRSLKEEYNETRESAIDQINKLKSDIKKKLEDKIQEHAVAKLNLKYLETRHQVGQMSDIEFSKKVKGPRKKTQDLEKEIQEYRKQINATSYSDINPPLSPKVANLNFPIEKTVKKEEPKPLVAPATTASMETVTSPVQPTSKVSPVELTTPVVPPVTVVPQEIIPLQEPQAVPTLEPALEPTPEPVVEQVPEPVIEPKRHLPSELTVSSFDVLPSRVESGSHVGIIAVIKNIGFDDIGYRLELRINKEVKDYRDLYLSPGNSEEITFMVQAGPPGEYEIDLDGQGGNYTVLPS
jgi:hypothetical protein